MELPSVLHQPKSFDFPKRSFVKKVIVKRSFQASWIDRWSWLHYIALMSAVCKLLSIVLVMPATIMLFVSVPLAACVVLSRTREPLCPKAG